MHKIIFISFIFLIYLVYFGNEDRKKHQAIETGYENCGGMNSSAYHVDNYTINFFYPLCDSYNYHCKEGGYCGMAPDKGYECKEDDNCETILLVKSKTEEVILKGFGFGYGSYKTNQKENVYTFGEVIKLQTMPDNFPYLVLKSTAFGSWGVGYYYHLYDTKNNFKKVSKIGPSYKGFYRDGKGNYIIDVQYDYWPEYGSNVDHLTDEISYRLTNKEEYLVTKKRFIVDINANKARIVKFSDAEVNRLMVYAKQSNKKITKAFVSDNDQYYFWTPESKSEKWPLKLLRIRESNSSDGYVYADLFNFIRNGRIDLAKQYFDILIPGRYNSYKVILPEGLNTKEKLWKGYLENLKEQGLAVLASI